MKVSLDLTDVIYTNLALKRPNGEEAIVFLMWFKNKSTYNESATYTGGKINMHKNNVGRAYNGLVEKQILRRVGRTRNNIVKYELHPSMFIKPAIKIDVNDAIRSDDSSDIEVDCGSDIKSDVNDSIRSDDRLSKNQAQIEDDGGHDLGSNRGRYSNTVKDNKRTVSDSSFFKTLEAHLKTQNFLSTSKDLTSRYFSNNKPIMPLTEFGMRLKNEVLITRFKPNDTDPNWVFGGTYCQQIYDDVYGEYKRIFEGYQIIIDQEQQIKEEVSVLINKITNKMQELGYNEEYITSMTKHPLLPSFDKLTDHCDKWETLNHLRRVDKEKLPFMQKYQQRTV